MAAALIEIYFIGGAFFGHTTEAHGCRLLVVHIRCAQFLVASRGLSLFGLALLPFHMRKAAAAAGRRFFFVLLFLLIFLLLWLFCLGATAAAEQIAVDVEWRGFGLRQLLHDHASQRFQICRHGFFRQRQLSG